jgi:hypothetical protein
MTNGHGRCKAVLDGFAPHIIEKGVSHIQLTNLDRAHGNHADQDKGLHFRLKRGKLREQPHGQKSHERPEQDLEEGEDIPFRHDPVLENKSPGLCQLTLYKR